MTPPPPPTLAFITLHGMVAYLVGGALIALGVVGGLAEGFTAWRRKTRGPSARGLIVGPLLVAAVGAGLMVVGETWPSEMADAAALPVAAVALAAWVAVRVWGRRAARAPAG